MSSRKYKVLVTHSDIPAKPLDKLKEKCEVDISTDGPLSRKMLLDRIKGKDGLFCFPLQVIDKELLDSAGENLKVVSTHSVGYEHIDLQEVKKRGIKVGYTAKIFDEVTGEIAIGLLLATGRRFRESEYALRNGEWNLSPQWLLGEGLLNSTVGIFGLGGIGSTVARMLQGFNTNEILYCSRTQKEIGQKLGLKFVSFEDLLQQSDFVVVTAALNEQTKNIFNREAFAKMKTSAVFINVARGGLVDQDALIEALKTGQIRAAGLDVMIPEPLPLNHPLMDVPNLTLLPHIGSSTIRVREQASQLVVDNILAGLEGTPMPAQLC